MEEGGLCEPNALASGVSLGLGQRLLGQAAFCLCPTLARTAQRRDCSFSGRKPTGTPAKAGSSGQSIGFAQKYRLRGCFYGIRWVF